MTRRRKYSVFPKSFTVETIFQPGIIFPGNHGFQPWSNTIHRYLYKVKEFEKYVRWITQLVNNTKTPCKKPTEKAIIKALT